MAGRPRADVTAEDILEWRKLKFTWSKIAQLLDISRSTLYRRLQDSGISCDKYTAISNIQLDALMKAIKQDHPNDGERLVQGHLSRQGISVRRKMLRDSIHRIDHDNVVARRRNIIQRREYTVPFPNFIWHIDSHHKMIRWRFVIHGSVDGFSRTITYMKCADNNRAPTVLTFFKEGVTCYGLPQRVRSDHGGENIGVWRYMIATHNLDYSCVLTGSSVHNERIERMWRDVHRCVVTTFSAIFGELEREELLDPTNEVDLYCLHYVFQPLISSNLAEFQESWNCHNLSSEGSRTPYQLFAEGLSEVQESAESFDTTPDDIDIDVSELTNDHVRVPRLSFAPCATVLGILQPLQADCIREGKSSYTICVRTVGQHLLRGCSECNSV